MEPDEAERLAGRLNFVCGAVAGAAGAARLKSIYRASYQKSASWNKELEADVTWWTEFMTARQCRTRPVSDESVRRATFFTDAAGNGGIGAVAFIDPMGPVFTMDSVGSDFLSRFKERLTYITILELASVVVTLHRFRGDLQGAKIVCFVDNLGVMHSLRKGHCRVPDVNRLIKVIADIISSLGCEIKFYYVPSKCNVADLPSRRILLCMPRRDISASVSRVLASLDSIISQDT